MTNPKTAVQTQVARAFAAGVTKHRMIVHLDHGLHRHLTFEQREHSWHERFHLTTWPGYLAISGDRGAHVFSRLPDMFQFFRSNGNTLGINPTYWAEKLASNDRSVKVYSENRLWEQVREALNDAAEDYRRELAEWRADLLEWREHRSEDFPVAKPELPKNLREARELVNDAHHRYYGDTGYEDGARNLLRQLENLDVVSDTWEWDLTDWDYHFLWCLHAIAWGVRQYDNAVRTGLHKIRPACMPWDSPLPTTAPMPPGGAA